MASFYLRYSPILSRVMAVEYGRHVFFDDRTYEDLKVGILLFGEAFSHWFLNEA